MNNKIFVMGLGAGDLSQMPLGVYEQVMKVKHVYVRTEMHPVIQQLQDKGVTFTSFDYLYEKEDEFTVVYEGISQELIQKAKSGEEILFAVPGHPMVAERTTQLLLEKGSQEGIEVEILGGQSFLDPMFAILQIDPVEGFALLDALQLHRNSLNPQLHLIITQVYDEFTASDVKLTLMDVYPDDYPVTLVFAAGVPGQQQIIKMPLYELDHIRGTHNMAAVYVPPTAKEGVLNKQFSTLREIVAILRGPEGCPWDREQTHQSIRKHLIEETYEVLETIDEDDPVAMCEEMGDLLMQVMLHSQISEDEGDFTIDDVILGLTEKLIRRHPHVFGDRDANTSEQVVKNWEQIKTEEKKEKGINMEERSLLDGIPRGLPGLMTSYELSKKAAKVGFDWDQVKEVYAKIEEELEEVKEARHEQEVKEELGDLLFAVANLARFLKVDPEEALSLTNRKFKTRFKYIEQKLKEKNQPITEATLDEMEALWQEAKQQ